MEDFLDEIPECTLDADGVALRLLKESEAEELFKVIDCSREFLGRTLPWPQTIHSASDVLYRIESWTLQASMGSGACFGIYEETHDGVRIAGCMVLGWIEKSHRSASVSYWIGESFTGRQIVTKALGLLCDYAFGILNLNRLEVSASVENGKSRSVALRAGFKEEGLARECEFLNGRFLDHIRYSRLKSDWLPR